MDAGSRLADRFHETMKYCLKNRLFFMYFITLSFYLFMRILGGGVWGVSAAAFAIPIAVLNPDWDSNLLKALDRILDFLERLLDRQETQPD